MFADCEGCYNLTENEDGIYTCDRYCGEEIDRIFSCEEWEEEGED